MKNLSSRIQKINLVSRFLNQKCTYVKCTLNGTHVNLETKSFLYVGRNHNLRGNSSIFWWNLISGRLFYQERICGLYFVLTFCYRYQMGTNKVTLSLVVLRKNSISDIWNILLRLWMYKIITKLITLSSVCLILFVYFPSIPQ